MRRMYLCIRVAIDLLIDESGSSSSGMAEK